MKLEARNSAGEIVAVKVGWTVFYDRSQCEASFSGPDDGWVSTQVRIGQSGDFCREIPVMPENLESFIRKHVGCTLTQATYDDAAPEQAIHKLIAVEPRPADMPPTQPRFIDPADPLPEYNRDYGASD